MNPFRAWNRFWFAPISARPLRAFRIVFGLLMLANLAFLVFELDYWFTNTGLLQGAEAREVAGPLRVSPYIGWTTRSVSASSLERRPLSRSCSRSVGKRGSWGSCSTS